MNNKVETLETEDKGNTKPYPAPKKKKQVVQLKKWCFTYNNYDLSEIEILETLFNDFCEKFIFQQETGESGTRHLQGAIWTKNKLRPSELKLNKAIHWEGMKGTDQQVIDYCSKLETRSGNIYKSSNIKIKKPLKIISQLKIWQKKLENIILEEPDDRAVHWIYEATGGVGKSSFTKYAVVKHDALIITEGKKSDIINMVYNYVNEKYLECVIIDVPRSNGNNVSYKSIEEIKNGLICNTKYETGNKVINPPHIIIFANCPPDAGKLSLDRWKIWQIIDNDLISEELNNDIFDEKYNLDK